MKTIGTSIRLSLALFFTLPAMSLAGAVLNYHGRILDNTDRPLEAPAVTFRIRIYSPNPSKCLLYEETRTLNMRNSQGVFVIPIGDGHGTRADSDPGITMEDVFANNGKTISSLVCNSTNSYTSQALDQRQMTVSFDDNTGYGWDNLPPMDISYVPFAVHAYDAQNIGGAPANSVLKVSGGNASPLSPANFSELLNLINGSTSQYEKIGKLGGQSLPSLGNGQVLGWNAGAWTAITPMTSFAEADPSVKSFAKFDLPTCAANSFLKNDGAGNFSCVAVSGATGGTVTSVAAGAGLLNQTDPGNPITSTGTLAVNVGTGMGQIVQLDGTAKLPAVDGSQLTNVTASGLSNTASISTSGNITTTGNIQATQNITSRRLVLFDHSGAGPDSISLQAPTDMAGAGGASYSLTFPEKKGVTGQVLAAKDGNGILEWISPSTGSVTSVTASPPLSSSAGSTPNISLSKATAAQDGYLSKEDWDAFNNKAASGNYITALSGDVTATGPGSAVTTIANNAITSAKILNGTVVGANLDFTGVNTATSNFVMKDNSGKFYDFACSTTGHVPTWTVAGFACQAPVIVETDPKIGSNTLNMLSKWNGSALVTSGVYENGGNVGIGTATPSASALLAVDSTTKGFLPPRMTTAQRNGISSPTAGLIVYDSSENKLYVYNGSNWAVASDSASGVFQYKRTGNMLIGGSGATTRLIFNTKTVDADNNFNPATGIFTAPQEGFYHFSTSIAWDSVNNIGAGLRIRTTGGITIAQIFNPGSGNLYQSASGGYYLTTGQQVEVIVWQWTGGNANITMGDFSGFRVGAGGNGGGGGVADNLGNHTAVQNLILGSHWLSGDGDAEGIRVDVNGNVGVGTATPGDKLHVAGKIRAQEICDETGANCKDISSGWGNGVVNLSTDVTGTLPIANGGTGATTQSGAINALLPSQGSNAGKILQTNGTNVSWVDTPATGITALTGDVTASGSGSVVSTIANGAVNSAKIADGTVVGADLNFTGVNSATSSLVMKDSTGKFYNFACSTTGHVPTWTVAGFACQAPSIAETDPKIGANTLNMLSKWDGSRMIASTVYENSGNVGIGTSSPAAGLEVNTTGASSSILVPRDTTGNRPSSPVNGMIRYNTTTSSFEGYAGNTWGSLGDSSVASSPGVAFHAHKNGVNQTVTSGVYTKITWPTEVFDTNNNFANSRFTPTVAGKYLINLGVVCAGSTTDCYGAIYKNGSIWVNGHGPVYSQLNIVIDMNGTTDYIEAYVQNSGGTSFWADSNYTYFSGSLLSSSTIASGGSGTANYVPFWTSATALGNSPIAVSGGNVGIGTTSPGARLTTVGGATFDVSAGGANGQVLVTSSNSVAGQGGLLLTQYANYPAATEGFKFYTTSTGTIGAGHLRLAQVVNNAPDTVNDLLTIRSNGNVGIGTMSPAYKLHVVGTAGLSTGTAWTNASDVRLKDIHGDYHRGLDEILQLHTVLYNYKKDNALGLPSDFVKTGFIAQEVQKVIPEAVNKREDGYLELNVDPIHWAVVNAIKEFYYRWFHDSKEIRRELASVKAENEALRAYLCAKDPKASICN